MLLNTVGDAESRASFRQRAGRRTCSRIASEAVRGQPAAPRDEPAAHPRHQEPRGAASFWRARRSSRTHLTDDEPRALSRRCRRCSRRLGVPFEIDAAAGARARLLHEHRVRDRLRAELGAQNALCGGGAYEGLVEELGGPPTYGVGFAIGEDRLIEVLPAGLSGPTPAGRPGARGAARKGFHERGDGACTVRSGRGAARPESPRSKARAEAEALRARGDVGSPAVVFVGDEEIASGTSSVRVMASREQVVRLVRRPSPGCRASGVRLRTRGEGMLRQPNLGATRTELRRASERPGHDRLATVAATRSLFGSFASVGSGSR